MVLFRRTFRQVVLLAAWAGLWAAVPGQPAAAYEPLLITPTAIEQTASDAPSSSALPVNLINNSGLSSIPDATNYTTVTHSGGTWYSSAVLPNYFDAGGTPPVFLLSLEEPTYLTDLVIWGYGGNNNEASDFLVEFSQDGGVTYYDSATVATSSLLGTGSATLSFGDVFLADNVRLTMTDNAGGRGFSGTGYGDRVGLGEIKFLSRVPEPSSLSLLVLAAIVLVGGGRRRSRQQ